MSKREFKALMILSLLLISLTFQNISIVVGLEFVDFDPENDVFYIVGNVTTQGDFHEEIDIVKLEIEGQSVILTFAGMIDDWKSGIDEVNNFIDTSAAVAFFEDFDFGLAEEGWPFLPDYYIFYGKWTETPELDVFFIKFNEESRYNISIPFMQFWTGINWSETSEHALNVGFTSNNLIIANIPMDAYIIPENVTCFAQSIFGISGYHTPYEMYLDIAPEEYASYFVDLDNIEEPENEVIRIIILGSIITGLIGFVGLAPIIILHKRKKSESLFR